MIQTYCIYWDLVFYYIFPAKELRLDSCNIIKLNVNNNFFFSYNASDSQNLLTFVDNSDM